MYPAQPGPYGQQPGPYGQQPVPHGQPHGGYPPGPGGFGPGPRKSNAPAIVAVLVVVVLLAGLGITGFVAPGFFLGDDSGDDTGGGGDSGIDRFAAALVDAADSRDTAALGELRCADAASGVDQAINEIDNTSGAVLTEVSKVSDTQYSIVITVSAMGGSAPFVATATGSGDSWCWQDFAPGTDASGGDAAGEAPPADQTAGAPGEVPSDDGGGSTGEFASPKEFAEEFLFLLYEGDEATATAMICADTMNDIPVPDLISQRPRLVVAEVDEPSATGAAQRMRLTGKVDGEVVDNAVLQVNGLDTGTPCIYYLSGLD